MAISMIDFDGPIISHCHIISTEPCLRVHMLLMNMDSLPYAEPRSTSLIQSQRLRIDDKYLECIAAMSRVIARAQVANTHHADFAVRLQSAWVDPMMLRFNTDLWT
jgi:hypothetical protein